MLFELLLHMGSLFRVNLLVEAETATGTDAEVVINDVVASVANIVGENEKDCGMIVYCTDGDDALIDKDDVVDICGNGVCTVVEVRSSWDDDVDSGEFVLVSASSAITVSIIRNDSGGPRLGIMKLFRGLSYVRNIVGCLCCWFCI